MSEGVEGGSLPERLITALTAAGATVAAAESLTGGLLTARLTSVPGASMVVRGGVVSYATDVKAEVLGVDPGLLASVGPVDGRVAEQMARGVRRLMGATYGVATTGEAGPDSATGAPVGTVYVAVAGEAGVRWRAAHLTGDRGSVREGAVGEALSLLSEFIGLADPSASESRRLG